mmetsp:Transcript_7827/g.20062  ORF Transcript_7827/g.20062 Transcript_7827/m.20062 type:complete len:358 (+) Transcript_7827:718-1791(+)
MGLLDASRNSSPPKSVRSTPMPRSLKSPTARLETRWFSRRSSSLRGCCWFFCAARESFFIAENIFLATMVFLVSDDAMASAPVDPMLLSASQSSSSTPLLRVRASAIAVAPSSLIMFSASFTTLSVSLHPMIPAIRLAPAGPRAFLSSTSSDSVMLMAASLGSGSWFLRKEFQASTAQRGAASFSERRLDERSRLSSVWFAARPRARALTPMPSMLLSASLSVTRAALRASMSPSAVAPADPIVLQERSRLVSVSGDPAGSVSARARSAAPWSAIRFCLSCSAMGGRSITSNPPPFGPPSSASSHKFRTSAPALVTTAGVATYPSSSILRGSALGTPPPASWAAPDSSTAMSAAGTA